MKLSSLLIKLKEFLIENGDCDIYIRGSDNDEDIRSIFINNDDNGDVYSIGLSSKVTRENTAYLHTRISLE
jgi:hypothetical protein